MADHVDAVEANVDREIPLSTLNEVATEDTRKMFYALTMLLRGPLLLLLKVERGNGFEAWRPLVERYDGAKRESTASHAAVHHASKGVPSRRWRL